jgi:hypothetical protein
LLLLLILLLLLFLDRHFEESLTGRLYRFKLGVFLGGIVAVE